MKNRIDVEPSSGPLEGLPELEKSNGDGYAVELEVPAAETTMLTPAFFLHEVHEYTDKKDTAHQQIFDTEGKIVQNPEGGLRIDELYDLEQGNGQDIIVLHRDDNGGESIYEYGTVVSEPYFADDDLWWIDFERKDLEGGPFRVPRCLGILGVTLNDRGKLNPYFYVVPAPFEPAQDSPNLNG